jgi:hypothetical protein
LGGGPGFMKDEGDRFLPRLFGRSFLNLH